jgi:hypothetical protein
MAGLRDRVLTRRVASRMTSPAAILAAGAGGAAAIVAGAPLAVAGAVGVAGWAAVVGAAVGRGGRRGKVDARRLPEPWAGYVREAQDAAQRYRRALSGVGQGPVAERLREIGGRVEDGVHECYRIASRGAQLDVAAAGMEDPARITERLAALLGREDPTAEDTRASLRAQLQAAQRVADTRQHVAARLQLLDARLDEAVARAIELGLAADSLDAAEAGSLGTAVDAVVSDMEALRQALEETAAL